MSETNPELGINGYLPELIRGEYFANPFEAKIVANWWTHPELQNLGDAIVPTIDTLSPAETLEFARYVDKTYLRESDMCSVHSSSIWDKFAELSVDERGVVRAIVGRINDVKDFFLPSRFSRPESEDVRERFGDRLYESLLEAAEAWQGAQFANELVDKLRLEEIRRQALNESIPNKTDQ